MNDMKELKFRFYDPHEFVGMYNVVEIRFDEQTVTIEDDKKTSMLEVIDGDYHTSANGWPTYRYGFQEGHLMQSTGQKDMEGVEIFEGDLVSYFFGGINIGFSDDEEILIVDRDAAFDGYCIAEIVMGKGQFNAKHGEEFYPVWDSERNIKVIGNKYENPELIHDGTN